MVVETPGVLLGLPVTVPVVVPVVDVPVVEVPVVVVPVVPPPPPPQPVRAMTPTRTEIKPIV